MKTTTHFPPPPPNPHDTPAHDDAPPLQVWLKRLGSSDDIFKTKPAHMDTAIPKYPTKLGVEGGGGGWGGVIRLMAMNMPEKLLFTFSASKQILLRNLGNPIHCVWSPGIKWLRNCCIQEDN